MAALRKSDTPASAIAAAQTEPLAVNQKASEPGREARPSAAGPAPAAVRACSASGGHPHLSIDDFMKVELRVGQGARGRGGAEVEEAAEAKVDAGTEQRTIVAGIAEAYAPEQLVGRTIVIVANLKPAKLMGIESNGMVLAASVEGGQADRSSASTRAFRPGPRVR